MSKIYTISVALDLKYVQKNMEMILQRGKTLGFSYSSKIFDGNIDIPETINRATFDAILENTETKFLYVKINDTCIQISFDRYKEDFLRMRFLPSAYLWRKYYEEEDIEDIDTIRYMDEILTFLKPFRILNAKFEIIY